MHFPFARGRGSFWFHTLSQILAHVKGINGILAIFSTGYFKTRRSVMLIANGVRSVVIFAPKYLILKAFLCFMESGP